MKIIEGNLFSNEVTIAIAVARFNRAINNNLLEGSIDILKRIGHVQDKNITVVWIPGAYELPLMAQILAVTNKYDALIALGTVIRGATKHFEFVSRSCIFGLSQVSIKNRLPIGLGVLTADNLEQAIERSGVKNTNKGSEAALSVLEMIHILKMFNQ